MKRIDTHIHVFEAGNINSDGSRGYDIAAADAGGAELLMAVLDSQSIDAGILVNPLGGYGTDNSYMLRSIAAAGGRLKGIALLEPDADEAEAAALAAAGVVGLRFNLHYPMSPPLTGEGGERALAHARDHGWIIQVHTEGPVILDAMRLLSDLELPIVIDHCGRPDVTQGLDQAPFQAVLALADNPNAHIKLSGAYRLTREGWPYRDIDPYVEALVAAFTPDRCLWGSDWPFPRAGMRVDYGPILSVLTRWVPDEADRAKILGDNPAKLFGF